MPPALGELWRPDTLPDAVGFLSWRFLVGIGCALETKSGLVLAYPVSRSRFVSRLAIRQLKGGMWQRATGACADRTSDTLPDGIG